MMVLDRFGEAKWRAICDAAGLTSDFFIGFEYYPDEKTMDLIGAIAQHVGQSEDDVLFDFGHYWIIYAKSSAYGRAMEMAANDLYGFFQQLDRMHAAIKSNLPRAEMPTFSVCVQSDDCFEVHYLSSRDGLQPFVHGLIESIAGSLGECVDVTYDAFPFGAKFRVQRC